MFVRALCRARNTRYGISHTDELVEVPNGLLELAEVLFHHRYRNCLVRIHRGIGALWSVGSEHKVSVTRLEALRLCHEWLESSLSTPR